MFRMDVVLSFSGVNFILFFFVFVFMLSLKPRPFVQSSFDMFLFWGGGGGMSLFPSIFCTIAVSSWNGEYAVRSFLPDGVFYLVTTGWVFDSSLCENSINKKQNILYSYELYGVL